MNWKTRILWFLVFAGLTTFFLSFASFLFDRQEELQLFIPGRSEMKTALFKAGQPSEIAGLYITQYYYHPLLAAVFNALLLTVTGIVFFLILQRIAKRPYNFLLALFPVFALLKAHIQLNYPVDGTLGILVLLLLLSAVFRVHSSANRLFANLLSVLILYWFSGQLVLFYGILYIVTAYLYSKKVDLITIVPLGLAIVLSFLGVRYANMLPVTDGLRGRAYHEAQLNSESYVYFTWFLFSALIVFLFGVSWFSARIQLEKRNAKTYTIGGVVVGLFVFSGLCLPDEYDIRNRMMDELAFLSRRQKWESIIEMHSGKKIPGSVNLNYLNMSLAHKGLLGDRLFYFDQNGPRGLLAPDNHTFYMSVLLSDIHFFIGDISLSEGYAMDALTLSKGGSARVLQRLVQISLIRKELALAAKYIGLLKQMPVYRDWALRYETYLADPGKISQDQELKGKYLPSPEKDNLLCLFDIDILWNDHLSGQSQARTAYEYTGCSYLLSKKADKFKEFLLKTAGSPVSQPLPLHFQEAALLFFGPDTLTLNSLNINQSVRQRYDQYLYQSKHIQEQSGGVMGLYKQFGNTFWFYYHFKKYQEPS